MNNQGLLSWWLTWHAFALLLVTYPGCSDYRHTQYSIAL
jgi:hypothetical protein